MLSESVVLIRKLVSGVCATGQEQLVGLTQTSNALAILEQLTHMTSATAEENAALAESLQSGAEKLSEIVKALGD